MLSPRALELLMEIEKELSGGRPRTEAPILNRDGMVVAVQGVEPRTLRI